jgi:hypothetical protein
MLVKSPNGVQAIGSVDFIFFVLMISFHPETSLHPPFSSAFVQTKYELPMRNVRVWEDA